jgi:hypothetical protein
MEHGMPRLRVFDPSIFREGRARFNAGRVCSHEALLTIFRGALIKELGKTLAKLTLTCQTALRPKTGNIAFPPLVVAATEALCPRR